MKVSPIVFPTASLLICSVVSLLFREDTVVLFTGAFLGLLNMILCARVLLTASTQRKNLTAVALLVATLIPIGIAYTDYPLKLAFRFVAPRFDEIANQVSTGAGVPPTPFQIGIFQITEVGVRGKEHVPYFRTYGETNAGFDMVGFVRHPLGHGFNLWSSITLNDHWAFIAED